MMSRYFILILCIFMVSCKSGKTAGSSAQNNGQPLIFLHYWSDNMGAGIDTMMQAFSAVNRGYAIKTTGFDHESFKISIKVMLAGGNPPDLFSYWAGARTEALVKSGTLAPLSDVWNENGLDTVFSPLISNACKYSGVPYILPVTQHAAVVFYNKKLFSQHGVVPPKTWPEFLAVCSKFRSKGIAPIQLGARDLWPAQFWFDYLLLRTAGPAFRNSLMTGKASYSDPKVKYAVSLWKGMIDSGYFAESALHKDWADASKAVALGESPMTLMGTWIIGLFDQQYKLRQGTDYDYFFFPVIDSSASGSIVGNFDGILLPRDGNVTKSKAVVSYFCRPEVQKAMSIGSGALSPSSDVVPEADHPVQKRLQTELRDIENWAFNYDLAASPEVSEKGLAFFGKFIENPSKYVELLDTLQRQADSVSTDKK